MTEPQKLGDILSNMIRKESVNGHCEEHGDFVGENIYVNGELVSKAQCPECRKIRLAQQEEARKQKEIEEAVKREQLRMERLFNRSGIPVAYQHKSFDNFIAEQPTVLDSEEVAKEKNNVCKAKMLAQKYVQKWNDVKTEGIGLLFMGGCGTGKTHLACSIMQKLMGRTSVMYIRAGDMMRRLASTWKSNSEQSTESVIAEFANVGILTIDEIGVQASSESMYELFFSILDARIMANKPTIMMTNMNHTELKEFLGERMVDRVREKFLTHSFIGKSKRKTIRRSIFEELQSEI